MYYAKQKKTLGEPPYDSGGSSVPATPAGGIPPAPRPQQPSHLTQPQYSQPQPAQPYSPYSPIRGSGAVFLPGGAPSNVPVLMQPVPQKPVAPPKPQAPPAYVPPTQSTYDPTQRVDQGYVPVAATSNLPQYDPAVAAQQAAEKQAQAAAAAAQITYIQPQYAPAQPAQPRPNANDRRAQAEQRRREMEARRKQNKSAQEAAAKARREAQSKAQRKQQDEYNKQQKKAYEATKRADEAYAKQVDAQEKAAQKQAEERAKLAKKAAEQNAKQIAAQQQQYQQQQAALQRQTEETRAKVEAAAMPSQAYAPITAAPSQSLPSDYPEGAAPPKLLTPQAQALAKKIYFTKQDVAATQKRWGDGSSEYTVSSGDRLLQEIMRRGAELEKMKSMRSALTPNQRKLANSVLHSTQKELEKMAGDIASGYSTATAASYDSERYGEAVSDLASTWNNKFNEMVQRVDLLQQMQTPALAPSAFAQLQYKLSDEERTKFQQALAYEAAPQLIKAADKVVADPSSGFFANMFASMIASPKAQAQGTAAAQISAQQPRPGEGADLQKWKDSYTTPEAPANIFPGGWAPDPSQAEKLVLDTQHNQLPYFEAPIQTVEAGLPSDYQSLEQQTRQATAEREKVFAEMAPTGNPFASVPSAHEKPYAPSLDALEQWKLEQIIIAAQQAWMSPAQFNETYNLKIAPQQLKDAETRVYNRDRELAAARQADVALRDPELAAARQRDIDRDYSPVDYFPSTEETAQQGIPQQMQAQHSYEKAVGDEITATMPNATGIFDFVRDTKDIVSSAKMYSSPMSLLDPKNLGPKIFDLQRPGFTTPKISAVPVDFLMRSSKDILTPYLQDAGRAFIDPNTDRYDKKQYEQQIDDAVGAGTKWVGKALVDTPAGDVARSYVTNYVFETGPIGNTFGAAAKAVGGRAREIAQAIPYAPAVGEASYGLLRTLLQPAVTRANAYASAAYDINRVRVASNEATQAQVDAVRQQHEYERVRAANQEMNHGEDAKLSRQQKNLQQKISMYEDALTSSDYFVPQQSADHFRRQELRQQMKDLLPQLKDKLQEVIQRRDELRSQQVSQEGPGQIFAPEMQARAEAAAIEEANQPYYGAVSF